MLLCMDNKELSVKYCNFENDMGNYIIGTDLFNKQRNRIL